LSEPAKVARGEPPSRPADRAGAIDSRERAGAGGGRQQPERAAGDRGGAGARSTRFPTLDGVRAIAAISVVAFHVHASGRTTFGPLSRYASHLNGGVALFFLLSGFLLYRPFVLARAQAQPVDVGTYLTRRIARIVPAYWLAFFALALWPGLPGVFSGSWIQSLAFLQIYVPAWNGTGLAVAWSLCTEIVFYLALPLYAWAMARLVGRGGQRPGVLIEALVLGLISVGSIIFHVRAHGDLSLSLPGCAYLFSAGMLLAICSVHTGHRISQVLRTIGERRALCWLAALAVFVAIGLEFAPIDTGPTGPWNPVYAPVAFLMLLPLTLAPSASSRLDRVLSSRLALELGAISYGIYLWHSHLIGQVGNVAGSVGRFAGGLGEFALTLAAACLAASLSYQLVERPILRWVHGRGRSAAGRPRG
jgi:peptidoglycan/LPS O-acetylase OafA/YrhL